MDLSSGLQLLGPADAVGPGQTKGYSLTNGQGKLELFVVNQGGRFFAFENRCPHTGASLNWQPDQFLDFESRFIQCALHGALFRIEDGYCLRGPCLGRSLRPLPLQEHDGKLWLDIQ